MSVLPDAILTPSPPQANVPLIVYLVSVLAVCDTAVLGSVLFRVPRPCARKPSCGIVQNSASATASQA